MQIRLSNGEWKRKLWDWSGVWLKAHSTTRVYFSVWKFRVDWIVRNMEHHLLYKIPQMIDRSQSSPQEEYLVHGLISLLGYCMLSCQNRAHLFFAGNTSKQPNLRDYGDPCISKYYMMGSTKATKYQVTNAMKWNLLIRVRRGCCFALDIFNNLST